MIGARLARQWRDSRSSRRTTRPDIAGIYAQAAAGRTSSRPPCTITRKSSPLTSTSSSYRRRLSAVFDEGSVFRADGRQDKQIDQIRVVLYNKMQEFDPVLWDPRSDFPAGSRFIVYLRNPVRVHLSRESYRRRHKPRRVEWVDSRENFLRLLSETQEILKTHETLRTRYPSLLMTHEYFCCRARDGPAASPRVPGARAVAAGKPARFSEALREVRPRVHA